MDTNQLEKQFEQWNRFMYLVLGSSITLVLIGFGFFLNRERWEGFANYAGGIWAWVQILATTPGLILLLLKPWRSILFVHRLNTIFGYFAASWLSFLSLGLFTVDNAPNEINCLIFFSAMLLVVGYIWALRRISFPRDDMFP